MRDACVALIYTQLPLEAMVCFDAFSPNFSIQAFSANFTAICGPCGCGPEGPGLLDWVVDSPDLKDKVQNIVNLAFSDTTAETKKVESGATKDPLQKNSGGKGVALSGNNPPWRSKGAKAKAKGKGQRDGQQRTKGGKGGESK